MINGRHCSSLVQSPVSSEQQEEKSDGHHLPLVNPAWLSPSTSMSSLGLDRHTPRRTCSTFFLGSRLFFNRETKAQLWDRQWLKAGDGGKRKDRTGASDRGVGQSLKPKDSLRELHKVQEAPPKPASVEGRKCKQGLVLVSPSLVTEARAAGRGLGMGVWA